MIFLYSLSYLDDPKTTVKIYEVTFFGEQQINMKDILDNGAESRVDQCDQKWNYYSLKLEKLRKDLNLLMRYPANYLSRIML